MNINNPVEVEQRINYLIRQYKQVCIEIRQRPSRAQYLQNVTMPTIIRKGKWARAQLNRINAKVQSETVISAAM